jgi:carbon monoxide dehydrogenase subunit G
MDMSGSQQIAAQKSAVWSALNDAAVLKQCIPGCQTLEAGPDNTFTATVQAKVGPVSAKFAGKVALTDIDPPNGYTLSGEGSGGVAGFAKGSAVIKLSDQDGGTLLSYDVKAQVGGKLAQIGARLIDGAAAKMAEDFFSRFKEAVMAREAAAAPTPVAETPPAIQPLAPSQPPAGGLSPWLWAPGLVILVLIVLALVLR